MKHIPELHDRLAALLLNLELVGPSGQLDMIIQETIETGGTWVDPEPGNTWSGQIYEISLHGVSATGTTSLAALRRWKDNARRVIENAQAA